MKSPTLKTIQLIAILAVVIINSISIAVGENVDSTNKDTNTTMSSNPTLTTDKPIDSGNITHENSDLLSNNDDSGTSLIITNSFLVMVGVVLCLLADSLRYK
ncbi:hypothetical protein CHUAL_003629 [Chamberlinius hualienensis]